LCADAESGRPYEGLRNLHAPKLRRHGLDGKLPREQSAYTHPVCCAFSGASVNVLADKLDAALTEVQLEAHEAAKAEGLALVDFGMGRTVCEPGAVYDHSFEGDG
jgi:hypothetical protein